jgi:putative RNA 2'-phosphotransferase
MNSKYLSLLLRHKPEKANLILDKYGWCPVDSILSNLKITQSELDVIVNENNKKRFRYDNTKTKIKASQGHSIPILDDFKQLSPPDILYHGTSVDNAKKIQKDGLKKMRRNHVHMSDNIDTAKSVGMRYAKYRNKLRIYEIDAKLMNSKGYKFYLSDNGVWLTDNVPFNFLNKQ